MCEPFDSFSKFIQGNESQDSEDPHPIHVGRGLVGPRAPARVSAGATPPCKRPEAQKSEAKSRQCLRKTRVRRRAQDFAGDGARHGRPVLALTRSEARGGQGQRRGGRLRPGSAEGRLSQGSEAGQTGGQHTLGWVREDHRADCGTTTSRPQTAGRDSTSRDGPREDGEQARPAPDTLACWDGQARRPALRGHSGVCS